MTDDEPDADKASDGRDYIFRGEDEPTDWNVGAAPPPTPVASAPSTPSPSTAPPPPPPVSEGPGPALERPRRKRWPWIVAALVVFCALPLGGCIALVSFGLSEINERGDTITEVADDFMDRVVAGDAATTANLIDGGAECVPPDRFVELLDTELPAADGWESDDVRFVDRDGSSYLANVSDAEDFVLPGREDDGLAVVSGRLLDDGATTAAIEIILLKPGDAWRVCTVGVL